MKPGKDISINNYIENYVVCFSNSDWNGSFISKVCSFDAGSIAYITV